MIRLFAFISILSLFTNDRRSPDSIESGIHDSTYLQFLQQANSVSGEPIDLSLLDADFFILMDYGHCSKCAKEVLYFMGKASESGLRIALIHYGGRESYGPNRATRNKYRFEYGYLQEVYFSPVPLPDKSKVPVIAFPGTETFIEYDSFIKERELLLKEIKKMAGKLSPTDE